MGIGSFLSKAGYIGAEAEDFVNKREVQRAARAEAQARQLEMARQEQRRLDRMAMPDITDVAPTYDIGAPGSIAAGQFGVPPVTASVTPVSVPAPVPTTAPAPAAGVRPPVRAAVPKAKAGLESGVGGFVAVEPGASDVRRTLTEIGNKRRLDTMLGAIARETDVLALGLRTPFVSQQRKGELQAREAASDWYASDAAKRYFTSYPQAIEAARSNPLGFYKSLQGKNAQRDAAAKAAAPKAAAPATQAAATVTQDLTQYANVPFSQVRDQIVSIESTNYDTIAYDRGNRNLAGVRAPQPVTTMTIGQVLDFQRNQMRPQTKGFRDSKDVGSTGVGRYQFESGTLEENAKKAFGKDFRNMQFTPETQDTIAETLWDAVKGDPKRLAKTWGAFGGKQAGAAPAGTGGVQESAARQPQEPLAASDFYLSQPNMISRDTSNAVQMRQLLVQRANEFKKFGMINEFDQARAELINVDNNIRMLQGLQGITELETARDPRRLSAVWSDYAGTPIQIQPRTDGRFDIVVNGRVTSRGVDGAQIRDVARSTFDKAYLQQRVESSTAITMEQIKSQLKVNEATATAVLNAAKDIEVARVNGQAGVAKQLAMNLQARIAQTPDGNAWLMRDGTVQRLIADYVPPGAPEGVTPGPVALPIAGMSAGVRSVGVS